MTDTTMFRRWWLVISVISFAASVVSSPTSTTVAPDTNTDSEGVKFKSLFPFVDGAQYYGGSPYGYPQGYSQGYPQGYSQGYSQGYYRNNWPNYDQSGTVSYPSYVLPQQSYSPYPYSTYNSYPAQQSTPYSLYPQYGSGSYQYAMPSGYPASGYPAGSGGATYLPENTGNTDILKLLASSNVIPSGANVGDTSSVLPFDTNQQQLSDFYMSQLGYGSNGVRPGGYPSNNYDPFANIPVEIIDVDYTGGFKTHSQPVIPEKTKPTVKVTSHSDSNGESVKPIVKTYSSVVTMKPQDIVITRTYDSTNSEPTVNVQDLSNSNTTDNGDDDTAPEESNDIPDSTSTKNDEEPSDVSSWFK